MDNYYTLVTYRSEGENRCGDISSSDFEIRGSRSLAELASRAGALKIENKFKDSEYCDWQFHLLVNGYDGAYHGAYHDANIDYDNYCRTQDEFIILTDAAFNDLMTAKKEKEAAQARSNAERAEALRISREKEKEDQELAEFKRLSAKFAK